MGWGEILRMCISWGKDKNTKQLPLRLMNRIKSLVGTSILLIVIKIGLVVYSNSVGDGLVGLIQEFSNKKSEIENLKLVRGSVFSMQKPKLLDTIKTAENLNDFLNAHDGKIQQSAAELRALNLRQTQELQRLKICDALNTIINILIVCIVAWLLIGRFRE
jgi:hypothetical protein